MLTLSNPLTIPRRLFQSRGLRIQICSFVLTGVDRGREASASSRRQKSSENGSVEIVGEEEGAVASGGGRVVECRIPDRAGRGLP
jgi:hypothetical protein